MSRKTRGIKNKLQGQQGIARIKNLRFLFGTCEGYQVASPSSPVVPYKSGRWNMKIGVEFIDPKDKQTKALVKFYCVAFIIATILLTIILLTRWPMALMNKELCKETKKRGKWKKIMCGICSHYEKCIDRQEDEQKHDETREFARMPGDFEEVDLTWTKK